MKAKETAPCTKVTLVLDPADITTVLGDGAGTAPDADLGFPKLRATVAPAPYDAYAATQYRRH